MVYIQPAVSYFDSGFKSEIHYLIVKPWQEKYSECVLRAAKKKKKKKPTIPTIGIRFCNAIWWMLLSHIHIPISFLPPSVSLS